MSHLPRSPWLALAAMALAATASADPVDWSAYAKSFDITFPGYTGGETLTDFPVLIRLSAARNGFQYNKCKQPDGGDLRFSDADGNLLASEVDTWNPDGESLVWVKVPSLSTTTRITAHYGCVSPATMNPQDVWSNGYLGVWHLNEDASPLADSTSGGKNFTRSSSHVNMVSLGGAGIIGNAPEFAMLENQDGTHDGYTKSRAPTPRLTSPSHTRTIRGNRGWASPSQRRTRKRRCLPSPRPSMTAIWMKESTHGGISRSFTTAFVGMAANSSP